MTRTSRFVGPRGVVSLVCAALLALLASGCLPFANDVELTFEVEGRTPSPDLRTLVMGRLAAGDVSADVRTEGDRVHAVLEERLAQSATDLLTWSAGIELVAAAPEVTFDPADTAGLVAVSVPWPDGTVERVWEGSRTAVLRAAASARVGPTHRVVAEAVRASGRAPARHRTRVIRAEPWARVSDGVLVAWGEGPALVLRATKGSPAEAAFVHARRRSEEPRAPREVVVHGRTSLGMVQASGGELVLAFGEGPLAYELAERERRLLTSKPLPPLQPLGAVGLPPATTLGAACVVLPMLLSFVWLAFVRRFDRAHPEPLWLIGLTFLFGALAAVPAALAESGFAAISPWLDPRLASLGGRLEAFPLTLLVFTVVVGGSEELAKLAAAAFAARRPELDEPVDGIVYAVTAALGFAAAENVEYFAAARLSAPAIVARCFMSVPAHMFFAAIWGSSLGQRLVDARRGRLARGVVIAAVAHGLFDAFLVTEGMTPLALALNVVLASAFIGLTRKALRHGIVPSTPLAPAEERRLVPVGRPRAFVACAVLVHVLALALFLLGAAYQMARHRPEPLFVIGSAVVLGLLAVAAWAITHTMELDVVIDAHGVTFAGATRAWPRIRGYARNGNDVVLDALPSSLVLGPGKPEALDRICGALDEHLATTLESARVPKVGPPARRA